MPPRVNRRRAGHGSICHALLFVLGLLLSSTVVADEALEISNDTVPTSIRSQFRAVFETDAPLDPESVARLSSSTGLPHPSSPPHYGRFTRPVWAHATIINRTPRHEWILAYTLSTVESITVFVRPQGEAMFRPLVELGNQISLPFAGYRSATYSLDLQTNVPLEIVARLRTRTPVGFHFEITPATKFFEAERLQIGLAGLESAVPLVVVVYGLILATVLRQRGIASLMVLLVAKLVIDAWISGLGQLVLPLVPRASWPSLGFIAVGIFIVASTLHIRQFLELPRTSPLGDKLLLTLAVISATLTTIELTGLYNVRLLIQLQALVVFAIFTAVTAYHAWRRRYVGDIAYAMAWAVFLSEAIFQVSRLFFRIPLTVPVLEFGQSAIAALLFGIAIFLRIRDQDRALNRSLTESNERFRLAIEGSAAAIYELSFADGKLFCAPRMTEFLNASAGATGRELLRKLPSPTRQKLIAGIRQALRTKSRIFRVEVTPQTSGAEHRTLAVTGAIQYNAQRQPDRICGSVIDVTSDAALKVEQSLRRIISAEKETVERSLRARTLFYATANHDLRHPLLSLGIYLEMLGKDASAKRVKAFVSKMLEAHQSALRYLDRIVALARTDANVEVTKSQAERLEPILLRLIERYQADASRAGLRLRHVSTSLSVDTDAFLLERILSNLISNAIRNTMKGGILVGCRRMGEHVRIDVIDTGPGLSEEVYERFFEQSSSISAGGNSDGLRLGLMIVQRTANELGCRTDVKTRAGHGTRFSVLMTVSFSDKDSQAPPTI